MVHDKGRHALKNIDVDERMANVPKCTFCGKALFEKDPPINNMHQRCASKQLKIEADKALYETNGTYKVLRKPRTSVHTAKASQAGK